MTITTHVNGHFSSRRRYGFWFYPLAKPLDVVPMEIIAGALFSRSYSYSLFNFTAIEKYKEGMIEPFLFLIPSLSHLSLPIYYKS